MKASRETTGPGLVGNLIILEERLGWNGEIHKNKINCGTMIMLTSEMFPKKCYPLPLFYKIFSIYSNLLSAYCKAHSRSLELQ